ncbi:MAG TPA: GAF and ANTAR domain-containing protein [Humibacillus xanthopallidus]|nr:GAF and ANTAR domain-containing protein [Humibacillus xanthopallidus]
MDRAELNGDVSSLAGSLGRVTSAAIEQVGVDGMAVSVIARKGTPVILHTTDPVSEELDELQFTLGEGPGVDASTTGMPVLIADLEDRSGGVKNRWPVFRAEARRLGVRAYFAFPIRIGAIALGTVGLQRRESGDLDDHQLARALTMVDALAATLLDLGPAAHDEGVPTYPVVVHQAAGMVMAQLGCSIDEAMIRLRGTAFAEATRVSTLAADIVAHRRRMEMEES